MTDGRLKSFIERIEKLEEEKRSTNEDIKEVYAEAKGEGYDAKILRKVVALRRKPAAERETEDALVETYLTNIEGLPTDV